nr:hypothetical protein 3 [Alphaproteobacteria bacterium]
MPARQDDVGDLAPNISPNIGPNIGPNISPNISPNIGPNIEADICSACSALHIFVVVMPNAPTQEKLSNC